MTHGAMENGLVQRAREGAHAVQNGAAQLSTRAQDYAERAQRYAYDYAQRASVRTHQGAREVGDFVSTHALPLAFVGASLAYLAWSVQRERELLLRTPLPVTRPAVG